MADLEKRLRQLEQAVDPNNAQAPIGVIEIRHPGFSDLPLEEQERIRAEAVPEPGNYRGMPVMLDLRPPKKEEDGQS